MHGVVSRSPLNYASVRDLSSRRSHRPSADVEQALDRARIAHHDEREFPALGVPLLFDEQLQARSSPMNSTALRSSTNGPSA